MKTMLKPIQLSAAVFFAVAASCASAAIINVPADYSSIQDAVAAANPGDEILIQSGTYEEYQVTVWAPMTLTGTNGPVTIHATPDQEAVVEVPPGVTNVVFNGITIDRPSADADWMRDVQLNQSAAATFNNCSFSGPANDVGVIIFYGASATLNSCTFSNFNPVGTWSSAIYIQEWIPGSSPYSNLIMTNCTFDTGCNGWIRVWYGASDLPHIGNLIANHCTFKATPNSQALAFTDGGMNAITYNPTNALLFQDCTFEGPAVNNGSLDDEIEFYYTTQTPPQSLTFSRCVFKAYDSESKMMWVDIPAPVTFENCLFAGGQHETVMTVWGGPPSVNFYNCTMINAGTTNGQWENPEPGSTFIDGWDGGRTFNIVDCLFCCPTNYSPAFYCVTNSTGTRNYAISHSVIDHPTPTGAFAQITLGAGGYTNLSLGSAFVNPAIQNYQLTDGLPWVNGGIDLGYTLDVADNPRIQAGAPDMGAYESSFTTPLPTVSIAKNAGGVNISFIGVLQSATQVQGPYNDVPQVASPLTVSSTGNNSFWRARSP